VLLQQCTHFRLATPLTILPSTELVQIAIALIRSEQHALIRTEVVEPELARNRLILATWLRCLDHLEAAVGQR